jgi:uncharacterized protein YdeI (YjbR/CyaY-like superfamily)
MQPAGLEAYRHRKEDKSAVYSFENQPKALAPCYEKIFKSNKKAWEYFLAQAPSYRKVMFYFIMSAKQEATRLRRLERVIAASEKQKRVI